MIKSISARDARYPIGGGHGSDAIHKDPVYSYAVTLLKDDRGRIGPDLDQPYRAAIAAGRLVYGTFAQGVTQV